MSEIPRLNYYNNYNGFSQCSVAYIRIFYVYAFSRFFLFFSLSFRIKSSKISKLSTKKNIIKIENLKK